MKTTLITLLSTLTFLATAMDHKAPMRRKSCSPSRMNTVMIKHKRQNSFGSKVLISLHLKTDEEKDYSTNVAALVTDRRAPTRAQNQESPKRNLALENSDSRNLIARAAENNRKNFTKMVMLAHDAIKRITAIDDEAYKQYESHIKYARYYYMSEIALEVTKNSMFINAMVDEELKPLEEAFAQKIALLK